MSIWCWSPLPLQIPSIGQFSDDQYGADVDCWGGKPHIDEHLLPLHQPSSNGPAPVMGIASSPSLLQPAADTVKCAGMRVVKYTTQYMVCINVVLSMVCPWCVMTVTHVLRCNWVCSVYTVNISTP